MTQKDYERADQLQYDSTGNRIGVTMTPKKDPKDPDAASGGLTIWFSEENWDTMTITEIDDHIMEKLEEREEHLEKLKIKKAKEDLKRPSQQTKFDKLKKEQKPAPPNPEPKLDEE